MGHTYSNLMYHIVFSTSHRQRFIDNEMVPRLIQFCGGIIRDMDGKLLTMNATEDHAHIFAILNPKESISYQIRDIKAGSSKWIHRTFNNLQDFAWQEGYGAFSVSKSSSEKVFEYIQNQQTHHKRYSFEDEFIKLLEKHGIEYDPKYVFD